MAGFSIPNPVVDVPLSLFSGTDSELSPPDCPEGISPDNQDVAFLPGSVQSRPAVRRMLTTAVPYTIVYTKTYLQPNGDPVTLFFDSGGFLWVEDVNNSPGVYTQVASLSPDSFAQSVTAFGREYIAFSDLIHGTGTPYQYDGTYLDRVSQDGPGAPPVVADFLPVAATLTGAGASGAVNIVTITPSDPENVTVTPTGGGGQIGGGGRSNDGGRQPNLL